MYLSDYDRQTETVASCCVTNKIIDYKTVYTTVIMEVLLPKIISVLHVSTLHGHLQAGKY
jgi:hypothetical protein